MSEDKSIVLYHHWHYGRQYREFTKDESSEAIYNLRLILETVLARTQTISSVFFLLLFMKTCCGLQYLCLLICIY